MTEKENRDCIEAIEWMRKTGISVSQHDSKWILKFPEVSSLLRMRRGDCEEWDWMSRMWKVYRDADYIDSEHGFREYGDPVKLLLTAKAIIEDADKGGDSKTFHARNRT